MASPDGALPLPPEGLALTLTLLNAGEKLHRIHLDNYQAAQFNPGLKGNARFSPIKDGKGRAIPTLYAGTTFSCALMETVFHDVPHTAGFKSIDKAKFTGQLHSVIEVTEALRLVDLRSLALHKLGLKRSQLIDTEKNRYPATRKWAEAIYCQCPQAQGLLWISRQDDAARAIVLFGDRMGKKALRSTGASRSLLQDGATWSNVLDLAERIALTIVPARY
ncbi:MAG TPA: RES domain-containing protein [Erwinia sp.]|uniref:RES family NAD+ phosphorylase n=1 Tax=Erwinia citreus TaxID=558 RepID=UPI000E9DB34D|nr:RES family NAD+ phosphorylase [Erwinia sp.]HBV38417.1 RES domain-containing protein [Erwinia sp.]